MNTAAKQTLVLVKSSRHGYVRAISSESLPHVSEGDFPISLPTEVEFMMIADEDQLNNEISALKAERCELLANAQVKANVIDDRIQKLLAIESDHG